MSICQKPPGGWACKRAPKHDGPCDAYGIEAAKPWREPILFALCPYCAEEVDLGTDAQAALRPLTDCPECGKLFKLALP